MAGPADPYGVDLAVDRLGMLQITPGGDLATIDGPLNVAQALTLAIHTFRGELSLHPTYGLPRDLIGSKVLDVDLTAARTARALWELAQADPRMVNATDVKVITQDDPTVVEASCTLRLAGGELVAIASLDEMRVDDVTLPDDVTLDGTPVALLDDAAFLANSDAELDDLADQAASGDLVVPDSFGPEV